MKVTSKTSTKRILKATARLVDQGWIRGGFRELRHEDDAGHDFEEVRPCYCLIGALSSVCSNGSSNVLNQDEGNKIFDRAVKALAKGIPASFLKKDLKDPKNPSYYTLRDQIITWNDVETRKVGEVMKAIDRAIEAA